MAIGLAASGAVSCHATCRIWWIAGPWRRLDEIWEKHRVSHQPLLILLEGQPRANTALLTGWLTEWLSGEPGRGSETPRTCSSGRSTVTGKAAYPRLPRRSSTRRAGTLATSCRPSTRCLLGRGRSASSSGPQSESTGELCRARRTRQPSSLSCRRAGERSRRSRPGGVRQSSHRTGRKPGRLRARGRPPVLQHLRKLYRKPGDPETIVLSPKMKQRLWRAW